MSEFETQLRQILESCGLTHLAFYHRDRAKMFSAEIPEPQDESPAEAISHRLERSGRQLFYILEELASDFAELRTGSPIRTVVHVPTGALLYHSVAAESHLCCVTRADLLGELIPRLAEGIVDLRPSLSHHLGAHRSYPSRYARREPPSADPTPSPPHGATDTDRPETSGKAAEGTAYTVDQATGADDVPTATTDLMCEALGVHGLHYLAYYTGGAPTCTVDIFADPAVRSFLGSSTAQQRRDRYSLLGQLLPGVTGRMNTSLNALLEGEMRQIVLNIERGAVYFQQLREHCYLLGVSLDQSHLAEADRHIEWLGRELASE
ncbi:hypothetical protein [Streptomyces triticiradicis]|uniref:Uncharacterized protein n=1 Tax=Streptomyces triticiradicis TaxID=2651189 RepID=A0A7J5D590_9ACTN|nr:hypothetical protein [Streptomyces triticiradicis]KAB1979307.1 hypothetical protein F8144_36705 [Streptomyces triticiradicis]